MLLPQLAGRLVLRVELVELALEGLSEVFSRQALLKLVRGGVVVVARSVVNVPSESAAGLVIVGHAATLGALARASVDRVDVSHALERGEGKYQRVFLHHRTTQPSRFLVDAVLELGVLPAALLLLALAPLRDTLLRRRKRELHLLELVGRDLARASARGVLSLLVLLVLLLVVFALSLLGRLPLVLERLPLLDRVAQLFGVCEWRLVVRGEGRGGGGSASFLYTLCDAMRCDVMRCDAVRCDAP